MKRTNWSGCYSCNKIWKKVGPFFFFEKWWLVPQRKQEKLAKVSLWPKSHSGQSVILAKVSLWPKCHWPKCLFGQSVFNQMVPLAKVSFWPKCPGQSVSCQSVILAKMWFRLNTVSTNTETTISQAIIHIDCGVNKPRNFFLEIVFFCKFCQKTCTYLCPYIFWHLTFQK